MCAGGKLLKDHIFVFALTSLGIGLLRHLQGGKLPEEVQSMNLCAHSLLEELLAAILKYVSGGTNTSVCIFTRSTERV